MHFPIHSALHMRVRRLMPVLCLKLVVHEMNIGDHAMIRNLTATYQPFVATQMMLTQNWNQNAPEFLSFCQNEIGETFHGDSK